MMTHDKFGTTHRTHAPSAPLTFTANNDSLSLQNNPVLQELEKNSLLFPAPLKRLANIPTFGSTATGKYFSSVSEPHVKIGTDDWIPLSLSADLLNQSSHHCRYSLLALYHTWEHFQGTEANPSDKAVFQNILGKAKREFREADSGYLTNKGFAPLKMPSEREFQSICDQLAHALNDHNTDNMVENPCVSRKIDQILLSSLS